MKVPHWYNGIAGLRVFFPGSWVWLGTKLMSSMANLDGPEQAFKLRFLTKCSLRGSQPPSSPMPFDRSAWFSAFPNASQTLTWLCKHRIPYVQQWPLVVNGDCRQNREHTCKKTITGKSLNAKSKVQLRDCKHDILDETLLVKWHDLCCLLRLRLEVPVLLNRSAGIQSLFLFPRIRKTPKAQWLMSSLGITIDTRWTWVRPHKLAQRKHWPFR